MMGRAVPLAGQRRDKSSRLPLSAFSEEHWTLLAYIDVCCSGQAGRLEHRHLRTNSSVKEEAAMVIATKRETAVKRKSKRDDSEVHTDIHDDWDRLADLEAVGFVELVSYATGLVHIFPGGLKAAAALRAHGERGESLKTFSYL